MNTLKNFGIVILCLGIAFSCKKDKKHDTPNIGKGYLEIEMNLDIEVSKINNSLKSTAALTDSFNIQVYNLSDDLVMSFDYAIDVPPQIELDAGEYYVIAYRGNINTIGFDQPYYFGRSANFTIDVEETNAVQVNCIIQNCAVTINYSNNIVGNFSAYVTHLSCNSGSLSYESYEDREAYFPLEDIYVSAILSYNLLDGSTAQKLLEGTLENPQAGMLYQVNLDANLENGQVAINISAQEEPEMAVLNLTEQYSDLSGIKYGDLVITEVMYNPVSISDTYGEWIEVYNTTNDTINLNQLVIRRETSVHVINSDVYVLPGECAVLVRDGQATNTFDYIYGSSISLTNSGTDIGIYTYGSDGTNGNEICSIIYDNGGNFPTAEGTTICLTGSILDADAAKLGSNWCTATLAYDSGDLGSPGEVNEVCL